MRILTSDLLTSDPLPVIPTIIMRRALPGEKMTTLDGVERQLTTDMLMITDTLGSIAVGGVMGGAETEVNDTSRNILLEFGELRLHQQPAHVAGAPPAERGHGPLQQGHFARDDGAGCDSLRPHDGRAGGRRRGRRDRGLLSHRAAQRSDRPQTGRCRARPGHGRAGGPDRRHPAAAGVRRRTACRPGWHLARHRALVPARRSHSGRPDRGNRTYHRL